MKMDKDTVKLLKCIQRGVSASELHLEGFLFIQIARLLEKSLNHGFIRYLEDGALELTTLGMAGLLEDNKRLHGQASSWIEPLVKEKIPQLAINDLYIPTSRMIAFLKRPK